MRTKIIILIIILLSTISFVIALTLNNEKPVIEYSAEEQQWLEAHSNKSVYYYIDSDIPEIFDELIVTLELLLKMDFVETTDIEIVDSKDGLIFSMDNNINEGLLRTREIYTTSYGLYESELVNNEQYKNHKLGVIKNDYKHIDFINKYAEYELVKVNNYNELFTLINSEFIDSFILEDNMPLVLSKSDKLFRKVSHLYAKDKSLIAYMGTDQVVFQQILNKNINYIKKNNIIDNILLNELRTVQQELFKELLNEEEVEWINNNTKLVIGIEEQAPEIIKVNDKLYGVMVGIIEQYKTLTESEIDIIYGEAEKLNEEADEYNISLIWSGATVNNGNYSLPILESKYAVIGINNDREISSKYDLQQYNVGMVFDSQLTTKYSEELGTSNIQYYKDDDELISSLTLSKVDFIIMSKSKLNYYEAIRGVSQLDIQLELDESYKSRVEILNNNKILLSILNKVILVQDLELLEEISLSDMPITEEVSFMDYLWLIGIVIILVLILVITVIRMYMNDKEKRQMNYLFTHDQLTHLPNKYGLKHHVDDLISKGNAVTLFLIDIDNLKDINDRLGHFYGDQVIVEYSQKLLAVLENKTILGRSGGDEFVLVAPGIIEEITGMVEEVRRHTEIFKDSKKELYNFTVSIAITSYPSHGRSYDELYKFAEYTLDHTKAVKGSNSYLVFTYDIYENYVQEQKIIKEIKQGLVNEEFVLWFQPQIQLPEEMCIGAEVLVRWNHPVKGMVYPDTFIPVAEKNGLMRELDYYILVKACEYIKQWQGSMNRMKVSVNMSTTTFEDEDMINNLTKILDDSGIDTSGLTIEVTEDMGFNNLELAKTVFNELRDLNIGVALDDFGKGYSSLAYLEKLKFDILKIDKVFIDNIHIKKESYEIFKTIISLAAAMNIKVVAEGVENVEQLQMLKNNNNIVVQGYYYSKPLSLKSFLEYIQNTQK